MTTELTTISGSAEPVLYTPDETAGILRVGKTTVYSLLRAGEIESILISRRRRLIPLDSITAYVARQRTAAVPPDLEA